MTKEVQINGVEYTLIEVPADAIKFYILYLNELKYTCKPPHKMDWHSMEIRLSPGEYKITGKASALTEKDWQQIVERFNNGAFRDYRDKKLWSPDDDNIDFLLTAKESGYSILELFGLNPETTLILKRKA